MPATLSTGKNQLTVTASVGGIVGAPSNIYAVRVDADAPIFPAPPVNLSAYAPTADGAPVSWPNSSMQICGEEPMPAVP